MSSDIRTKRTDRDEAIFASELSYRRLFEAAQDGILILDVDTGRITDANPFLTNLLGFSHCEMVGKTVGELSPFKDVVSNQVMLERLQNDGYVRYEDLPLETRDARDAMPYGGTLTIDVENSTLDEQYVAMNIQAKPGRYVKISVTDSGTGISPAVLDKIFEPFFTTKEVGKGTGLGLSTVMAIVKSHEGIINVYSEPGKGTTFKVYLPAMETTAEARQEQSEQSNLPRGNGETVLLIDDEASILTITSQTLQAFGYRVLTATDGADAVAVYTEHKNEIAVVLTDMMMPLMDGPATIHALTRINPTIKIIATSGLNINGSAAKASSAGVKHFLTKPYTAGALLKTLRSTLNEARAD